MVKQADRLCDISAQLIHETPARASTEGAFYIYDGAVEVWLPKSLVENNGDGTFTMPEWLAKDKGLI